MSSQYLGLGWRFILIRPISMLMLLIILHYSATLAAEIHPGSDAFVAEMVEKHGFDKKTLNDYLANAKKRQSIIDAMTRPAEGKDWYEYRPIFVTSKRIKRGVEFWNQYQSILTEVEKTYRIPAEIIVAIIGVETNYGRITGSYPVIDALVTLAFHYPARAKYFRKELEHLFLLSRDEQLPLETVTGSYAGAMGWGQFMPSSYREYSVDFDGDGKRNLWQSEKDIIASVANYFKRHHWRPDEDVVFPLTADKNAKIPGKQKLKANSTVKEIASWGYRSSQDLKATLKAGLIELKQQDQKDYWLGLHNFYVITRYNHSAMYAMAVFQLSQEIVAARDL